MIRRRSITRANRPETPEDAFDLFAELANMLPSQSDPAISVSQIRTCYLDSVRALITHYENTITSKDDDLFDATFSANYMRDKLRKLHGRMSFIERLKWAFTWKPVLYALPEEDSQYV